MKKTLIALAVAVSAAVSGSAMAWTANGTGGSVDLGGTLTPVEKATPWEVKVGAAVTGLDAQIQKGQKVADISVNKAIPVLGIRTVSNTPFNGQTGITPIIDYHGAIDATKFSAGNATLTLQIKDANDAAIGTMSAPLMAAALISSTAANNYYSAFADVERMAFFGGLGKSSSEILTNVSTVTSKINALDAEISANFNTQNGSVDNNGWHNDLLNTKATYSAYYGSGIEQGKTIKITLDQAASGDAPILWKASLPVTVSYQ